MHANKRVWAGVALGAVLVASLSTGAALAAESPAKANGSVLVKAVDAVNTGVGLSNTSFTLKDSNGKLVANLGPTGQDGAATVPDLAPGSYSVSVTTQPSGYKVDTHPHSVFVDPGERTVSIIALTKIATFADEHSGEYLIRNVKSNHLLEIADDNTKLGAPIIQGSDNRSTWSFNNHDGHTRIVYKKSSDVVAVNSGSTAAGVGIIQWTPNGGADQDWDIVPTADGHYTIVNAKSGHVLAVSGGLTNPGERTIQWPATGGDDQKWDIIAY